MAVYINLARREEEDTLKEFGEQYRNYMESTLAWIPRFSNGILADKT